MKQILLFCWLPFLQILAVAQQPVQIIPQPVSLVIGKGSFTIDAKTSIEYASDNKDLSAAAGFLLSTIKNLSGYKLHVNSGAAHSISLQIRKNEGLGKEGYQLKVTPASIIVSANTRAGILYGIQTLLQTLPGTRTNAPLNIPAMEVKDYPRFAWRGMHLDVSRHFFSAELVKEYIDLMARYKLNTFHWHLVDDQGWRLEIKKYPELTRTGAWRVDQLDKVWGSRPQATPEEKANYGGYYTQEQVKEIIAYAAERNVTIIPEIEMPGHSAAAIASYPALSCKQLPQLPMTGGNYTNIASNYCAGNDSVFLFLQDVLSEVIQLFPSTYIHVGGDEVEKDPWKQCSRCQARIKAEGLKNEEELQSYFMKRIEKFIISKHRKMIGWDEILEGGLAPEAAVMSWRGEDGGIQAAKMKHLVVMTPGVPCYFDHYQAGPEGEPVAIGGMNTLKRVYDYEPIPKELDSTDAHYVLGAQANLWTEFITTAEQVQYMVLPRMLALAEVTWSPKKERNWESFNQRLQPNFRYFDQKGYHYCKGNFKAEIKPLSQKGKLSVALSTEVANAVIHYSTDGTEPGLTSPVYTGPFTLSTSTVVKAVTVINGKVMSNQATVQPFVVHQALGQDVSYQFPVSKYYMADGKNALTDGIRGSLAHNKYWHGLEGHDLVATIDLGSEKSVHSITLGCLQRYTDWIFLPTAVQFEISNDGINYTMAATIPNTIATTEKAPLIKDFTATLDATSTRFIRVSAKVLEACPKGHPGEGKPAWIFADELIVQ